MLVPYIGAPSTPNWISGRNKATQTVPLNRADNDPLTDCQVEYGYWSFTDTPPSLKLPGIVPTASQYPAVQVTITKAAGSNGGPVKMFLASVLGVLPADVSAKSVAMISFPGGMKIGGLKPLVATEDILAKYWDGFDPLNPTKPVRFKVGEPDKKDASVNDTMWTSFLADTNSNAYTKDLIDGVIPGEVWIGDSIHLQPGTRADDYGIKEMGRFKDTTVVIPIVDPATLLANCEAPIKGFIAFHITNYSQGGQYLEGYFDKDYVITNPQGAGSPNPSVHSTSNPPQLVY